MVAAVTLSTEQLIAASAAHTRIDTQRRMAIRALEDELAEIIRDVARLNKRQTWIRERLASIQAAEAL